MTRTRQVGPDTHALEPVLIGRLQQARRVLFCVILFALFSEPTKVFANVYKCPDATGKVVYQDAPCSNSNGDEKPFIASPSGQKSLNSLSLGPPPKDANEAAGRVLGFVAGLEHMVSLCNERVPSARVGLRSVKDKWMTRQNSIIEASQKHVNKVTNERGKGYLVGIMQGNLDRISDQFNRGRPDQRIAMCRDVTMTLDAQEFDFVNQPAIYESLRTQLPMN